RNSQFGLDNGIFSLNVNIYRWDQRISCRELANSLNSSAFFFAKSSLEIFREKTFAVRMPHPYLEGRAPRAQDCVEELLQHFSVYSNESTTDMKRSSSLSFPKSRRLTRASEFERVKREGLVRRGNLLTLSATVVENSGLCRVGFITSRRLGSAVIRNRVRRRLREIVRQHQHDL